MRVWVAVAEVGPAVVKDTSAADLVEVDDSMDSAVEIASGLVVGIGVPESAECTWIVEAVYVETGCVAEDVVRTVVSELAEVCYQKPVV